jgi:hypothetical protein
MNAYADRLAVDVVTAPLAEIDRRTLSEAWYCALNLARTMAPAQPPNRNVRQTSREPARVDPICDDPAHATTLSPIATPSPRHAGEPPPAELERRRPPGPLARKIERALARSQVPARRVTLTLQGRTGRVELLVRSSGGATHVIAVCTPGAHARVAQALAHARFALARRGIGFQARVQGLQR